MKTVTLFLITFFYLNNFAQSTNTAIWSVAIPSKSESTSVVVDSEGNNIAIYYHNDGSIPLRVGVENFTITSGKSDSEILLIKRNSMGDIIWFQNLPTTGNAHGYKVAVDDKDNVYATGYFRSSIKFGKEHNIIAVGGTDIFVVKFNKDGEVVWAKSAGGKDTDIARGLHVDKEQNVYITGFFGQTANFNPQKKETFNLTATAWSTAFIWKLDANGNFAWAKSLGGDKRARGDAIVTDSKGNVFVTGLFEGSMEVQINKKSQTFQSPKGDGIFLAKLDKNGNFESVNVPGSGHGLALKVDEKDNLIFGGFFIGDANFNFEKPTEIFKSNQMFDGFVAKYFSNGKLQWAKQFTDGFCKVNDLELDKNGNIYVVGDFYGGVNFDKTGKGHVRTSKHKQKEDVFSLVLNDKGQLKSIHQTHGDDKDVAYGITVDNKTGDYYICGTFFSTSFEQDNHTGKKTQAPLVGSGVMLPKSFLIKIKSN